MRLRQAYLHLPSSDIAKMLPVEEATPTAFLRGRSAHKRAGQAMAASG